MLREELLDALEIVRPGLSTKDFIPQASSFAFIDGRVITYNDAISISHPINTEIKGAIKGEDLYRILGKLRAKEVEIEQVDNEIKISCGKTKVGLMLQDEIKLPLDEIQEDGDWVDLPKKFLKAIALAQHTCAKGTSTPIFSCVNVGEDGLVQATDEYRITQYDMKEPFKPGNTLIPASICRMLSSYTPISIKKSPSWLHFKNESGTIFSCRYLDDDFPEGMESALQLNDAIDVTFPETLGDILDRADVFCDGDFLEKSVDITLSNRKIKVRAKSDSGWFEEFAKTSYTGDKVDFTIHPEFLKDICKKLESCKLDDSKIMFSGENWDHLICLPE